LLLNFNAFAEYGVNMTEGVTSVSRDIYGLHMMVFWVSVAIAIVVFGAMFYSLYAHRQSKGAVAANFHESTKAELVWTVVPIIILIGMAVPASKVLIDLEDTTKAEMSIKITGHQWKWQYDYQPTLLWCFHESLPLLHLLIACVHIMNKTLHQTPQ
jgi:cytochrome c oxidase subunit 2